MGKCKRCSCHMNDYNINCISYSGNKSPTFYFLGDIAEESEALKSKTSPNHFTGAAGWIFDEMLDYAGIERSSVAIANACRCYKADSERPTIKELDACFLHTYLEIKKLKPKLVVAMGEAALYQTTGKKGIASFRGRLLQSTKLGCKVFPIFHPTAIEYDPEKEVILKKDFKQLLTVIGEEPEKTKSYSYTLVDTEEKFDKMYASIIGSTITFDIETTGLDPYDSKLKVRTIQIGKSEKEIYVIIESIISLKHNEFSEIFKRCPIIGQNFVFDAKWMSVKYNIFPEQWNYDTCIAEYLINGVKNNDLNFLVGKYNPSYFGYWDAVSSMGGAQAAKDEEVRSYGASDVGTLYSIQKQQYKLLAKGNRISLFNKITMPCNKILTKMSLRGVKFDVEEIKRTDTQYEKMAYKLYAQVEKSEGVLACEKQFRRKFNPKSSLMVRWLLLDFHKLPILNETKKGQPSIGKEEMEKYAEQYKNSYCKIMGMYRSYESLRKNFLSGLLPKLVKGYAHTDYSLHATATGRPNSRNPNLLNIPRNKDIKKCIVARKGCKFVEADLSQIEVRVAAVIYDDKNLLEICNDSTKDFHCMIAAKIDNSSYEEFYRKYKNGDEEAAEKRQAGKAITFGVLYQEGAEGLARSLEVSRNQAQHFINDYYKAFPGLKKNIEKQKQFVIKHGFVETYFKFRRSFKDHTEYDHETLRMAVNTPIQGTAWNLLQLILIEIDKIFYERNLKACLLMQVYDSVVCESPDNEVTQVVKIVKNVMENINKPYEGLNRVALKTDVNVGSNYANLEEYKE